MKIKIKNKKIYEKALNTWGEIAQIFMLFEEMSELQKAICKKYRNKNISNDNIIDELADVEIMLEQMIILFTNEKAVSIIKQQKINRLYEKLKDN